MFTSLKVLKNGPADEVQQLNGENKGPNRNEDVLIKVTTFNVAEIILKY